LISLVYISLPADNSPFPSTAKLAEVRHNLQIGYSFSSDPAKTH
jgi:hypothetical protein